MELQVGIQKIENCLSTGHTMQGNNIAYQLLQDFPENIRLLQLYSLSLARLGAFKKALKIIERAYAMNTDDCESSGILGRVYKDLFKLSGNLTYARKSFTTYMDGYQKSGSYYPGINAAMMSFVIGKPELSKKLAGELIALVKPSDSSYWELSTLGEACLLLGDMEQAVNFYTAAHKIGKTRIGDINSSYQQLLFLKKYMDVPFDIINVMAPPTIAVFSGHMIDSPGRSKPRFPEAITEPVKSEIKKVLERENVGIAYSSAACGTDILFIESLLELGGEVNVILPFRKEEFIKTSVGFAGDAWIERFERALEKSMVSYITEENFYGGDNIYRILGRVMMGRCILRSTQLSSHPLLITVLQHESKRKIGGTADHYKIWPAKHRKINIDPTKFLSSASAKISAKSKESSSWKPEELPLPEGISHSSKCILFADVVGYSKLQEDQTPFFMYEVINTISDSIKNLDTQPLILNTWGDAVFAVYDNASDLMDLAVMLKGIFLYTNWESKGLPENLNIRIALHAGPVFTAQDPIRGVLNGYGSHINRTARIEPITLPGCIFASSQYAALLKLETVDKFRYEYVGKLKLPKQAGFQELYHIFE